MWPEYSESPQVRLSFAEPLNRTMIALLISLTAVFLLPVLMPSFNGFAAEYLAINTGTFLHKLYLWQVVTSIFLHVGIQHFLTNMIFLWFMGSALSNAWRAREFLAFFFMCGTAGSLCFYVFNVVTGADAVGMGASGAIFGLMTAYAMVFGEREVLAFFLIPMKAKYLVAVCLAIEVIMLLTGSPDGIAHTAHIGGAAYGFAYLKIAWRRQSKLAGAATGKAKTASRISGLEVMDGKDK